ncbi:MAG TPA: NAD(P)-dependent oxidoreductase [Candidatus Saccharimonadales bacterium]|nr:NAD(P)-dependent oxidoreductase [Candidatus Saccharimonadales bacterium]
MATARTSQARIGFVGLGIMGRPMAQNAIKAGFPVTVTNRTLDRAEPLRAGGATIVRTPREVAERSDIVVTMVTNAPDVETVTFGADGIADGAHEGLLAIDMSSISPVAARSFAERAQAKGFTTLDAPVSGGEIGAIEARLSIMVGGDEADVERARPLFEALGKTIVHIGGHGAGQACKLANQIAVAINNLGVSEALVFAAAMGIDLERTRQVIAGGAGSSWAMQNYAPKMLAGDFKPGFMVDHQQKDLRNVLDAAYSAHVSLPGTALAHELYTALQRDSGGREGNLAIIKVIERLSGIEARTRS